VFDFDTLGLGPTLNDALKAAGFNTPTPIQTQAIPLALKGHDILGLAQTGTGKTLAFGLPLIDALLASRQARAQDRKALILAPTRELVNQIAESLRPDTRDPPEGGTVVGRQSIGRQIAPSRGAPTSCRDPRSPDRPDGPRRRGPGPGPPAGAR
jgi:ATP-dependent RNA helicase RhlE